MSYSHCFSWNSKNYSSFQALSPPPLFLHYKYRDPQRNKRRKWMRESQKYSLFHLASFYGFLFRQILAFGAWCPPWVWCAGSALNARCWSIKAKKTKSITHYPVVSPCLPTAKKRSRRRNSLSLLIAHSSIPGWGVYEGKEESHFSSHSFFFPSQSRSVVALMKESFFHCWTCSKMQPAASVMVAALSFWSEGLILLSQHFLSNYSTKDLQEHQLCLI